MVLGFVFSAINHFFPFTQVTGKIRETLDFSGHCLGVRIQYNMLAELLRWEKELGTKPDPKIDALMKATTVAGQEISLVIDYVLKFCSPYVIKLSNFKLLSINMARFYAYCITF